MNGVDTDTVFYLLRIAHLSLFRSMNAEYLEQQLDKLSLTEREQCLLDISLGGEMSDEAIHTLIEGLDLEVENQNYLLMLSSLGFSGGWTHFPSEMIPRLKGVHRYHQAHVSIGLPWLAQQIRALAAEKIPVMLLKGAAMLTYYASRRPRYIYTYTFTVPPEHFEGALESLLKNGNTMGQRSPYAAVVKGNCDSIEICRSVFDAHNEQFSDVWERAEGFLLHGAEVLVPSQEDMFLHLMDTQSCDYFKKRNTLSRLQWLYDCIDTWGYSDKLRLEHLLSRARQLHITRRVRLMLRVFSRCFPELLGPEELEQAFSRSKEHDELRADGGD
ncbi:MAG: nucleotidyltransferase family protein [Clostridia bacterium]|nr:nucleotidyltransferase family protein [Clostridia bacterium]